MNARERKRNRDSLISQRNWYSQFRKESNVLLPGLPGDADSNLYWLPPILLLHLPSLNTLHLSPHSHTSPSIHLHVTCVSCCPFLMLFAWIHCVIRSRNPMAELPSMAQSRVFLVALFSGFTLFLLLAPPHLACDTMYRAWSCLIYGSIDCFF